MALVAVQDMDMAAGDELISLPERRAAQIAGVEVATLRYWDRVQVVQPRLSRRLSPRSTVVIYDFKEAVALLVVAELRRRGFSLHKVRKVARHLLERGYQEPFSELVFATDDDDIYFQHPDGTWEGGARPDQLVLRQVLDLDFIRDKIRSGSQRQPEDHGRIERRRKTMGFKPVFAGTRIPVATVVRWLQAGRTPERIIEAYPDLVEADIEAARSYPLNAASA